MNFLNNKKPVTTLIISLIGLLFIFNLFKGSSPWYINVFLFYIYSILIYWYLTQKILKPIINTIIIVFLLIISSFTVTHLEKYYPGISSTLFPLYLMVFFGSLSIYEYFKSNFKIDFLKKTYISSFGALILTLVFISITFILYSYITINSVIIAIIIGIIFLIFEIVASIFFLT